MQNPVMTFFSRVCKMNLFAIDPFVDDQLIEEYEVFNLFEFREANINTALGYSEIANTLFELSVIRNHYTGEINYHKNVSDA